MEERRLHIRDRRSQLREQAEAAHSRNQTLVQVTDDTEFRRYWASVEESVPAWEVFLLGKGPHPFDTQEGRGL
uniref:Uncharacterized protein n=1 Tax=Neogobius melanostomus TaxID=47308 RepID=A0A8C6UR46_9GOBI